MSGAAIEASVPVFWRDEALPFIEARSVRDGRQVCYGKHWHETFSIGLISAHHPWTRPPDPTAGE